VDDTIRVVVYVPHYNEVQLHSAIGYVTPLDKMCGREKQIFASRDRKLEAAGSRRQAVRAERRQVS
jgi:putative transposase